MKVPNWKTERYLLGELSSGDMAALAALEKEDSKFCEQLGLLRQSNEKLLAKYPLHKLPEQFATIKPIENRWLIPMSAVAALLICVTAFLFVFNGTDISSEKAIVVSEDGTRIKGLAAGLEIWRKTGESSEKLANNSEARAGDLLQVRYITEKKCYGVILSMDGNGVLTIHLSGKAGKAAELEAGRVISLSNAYELDDAPKFETFYFITDTTEFALAPIAEGLLHGKLPKGLKVEKITLKK